MLLKRFFFAPPFPQGSIHGYFLSFKMSFLTFLTNLVCQLSCCYTTLRQDPCPGGPPLEPGAGSLRHPKVREGGEDQAGKLLFRVKLPHKKNIEI